MKKKISLFIIFLFSLFLFYFIQNQKKLSKDLWDIVSIKSALIIELDNPNYQFNEILTSLNESNLKFSLNKIKNDYNNLDKILEGRISEFLDNNKIIISYFNLSNKTLEPVYYTYKKNLDENFIIKYLEKNGYILDKRNFNGEYIYESRKKNNTHVFSFLDNIIIYSNNSLVIEDVIRSLSNSQLSFKSNNPSLFSQVKILKDLGNLYVNYDEIKKILLNIFPQNLFNNSLKLLPEKSFYDINYKNGLIRMNGFSSIINSKKSVKIKYDSILNFMPSNTILYSNAPYNIDGKNLKTVSKALIESFNSNTFYEISIIKNEENQIIKNEKEIQNGIYSFKDDKILKDAYIQKSENDYYYINYGNHKIIADNYISLTEIKTFLDNKDFWVKKLDFNKFQKEFNNSHNILLLFDIDKLLSKNNSGIGFASVQLSDIQDKYYMSLNFSEKNNINTQESEKNIINEFSFQHSISSKPNIIFSHIDNKAEVIIQDEKNHLYHLSNLLKPIWSDSIEKIISKIFTIDYYKNNKNQILFSSKNKIYSYDRRGNLLTGFPFINPSESPIKFLNVIDYDRSKRYRIISSHDNGEIYFFDKNGNILKGWNPLKMQDNLLQSPLHLRVNNKDYIIIVLKNGEIYVKNRKGDNYNGFPFKLNTELTNKIYIERSSNSMKTLINILTDKGRLYKINLDGKIISSKDLYRNDRDSKFIFIHETNGKYPDIISYDNNNLVKGDNKIKFNNIEKINFQYYNLSKEEKILILTDNKMKKTYLLDQKLNNYFNPLANQNEISLIDYNNSIVLYKTLNNSLSMIELKK